jgi:Bacteriophage HK97-gp10, putative tail-component
VARYSRTGADFGAILRSPEIRGVVEDHAQRVAARARAYAPVDDGSYRASIHVEVRPNGGPKGDRPEALVVADDKAAAAVEFGNRHVRGQHVLSRALSDTTSH